MRYSYRLSLPPCNKGLILITGTRMNSTPSCLKEHVLDELEGHYTMSKVKKPGQGPTIGQTSVWITQLIKEWMS